MSRRKTVQINLGAVGPLIKEKCRSNAVFCEKMCRATYWVTDWYRKDEFGNSKPKNLPSPEEAAKMCEILSVEPEDILVNPEDIALVRSLMEEKKPTPEGELDEKAIDMLLDRMTIAELQELMGKTAAAMAKRAQNG